MSSTETSTNYTRTLKVGDEAPDFTLPTHNEGRLNLKWYRGRKNVVLAFYPGDWTPVCTVQIPEYQGLLERFGDHNTQVLGISVDSVACHAAWAKSLGGISYPLMADYYPHGEIARRYGVLSDRGYAERVVFLIDKDGVIRYIDNVDLAKVPSTDRLFEELAKLNA
ncbi:peroxiredoxin [candidate division GN15 bacterium]|uniref:Peroxiredoxin n=1 Tax=candidate division GN15 bacterium TaxID=2072418 RepID=A0A855X778_9BACT|nr:MAG: peroxiredoxin [candidate division GN15 bacterium]